MKRTREQVIWDFVQSWLHKAEGDLRACEHLLRLEEDDYFASAFHAHQAAEKFLKAFLVRHQIPFRKTHDLDELASECERLDGGLVSILGRTRDLTPFAWRFRYPGDDEPPASADVDEALGPGRFGMADETGRLLNGAINAGVGEGLGLGQSVTSFLASKPPQFARDPSFGVRRAATPT